MLIPLGRLGHLPEDTQADKQKKSFLVYMGIIMGLGGLSWGLISVLYDLFIPSLIPFGYAGITLINFTFFYFSKKYGIVKSIQVFLSLVLPFLFQWILGGFASTGAVMIWAVLPLIGSLSFESTRYSRVWLIVFVSLCVISGLIDPWLSEIALEVSPLVQALFFTINLLAVVTTVYALTVYFINVRDEAYTSINTQHTALQQSQAQLILSEKMAVLGRLIAGVAHEVNTPLGAIKASIGNIRESLRDTSLTLPVTLEKLDEKEQAVFFEMLVAVLNQTDILGSQEERKIKRRITSELDNYGIENARDLADTLVDCGLIEVRANWVLLLQSERGLDALRTVFLFAEQFKNSQNVELAADRAAKIVFALKSYSHSDQQEEIVKTDLVNGIDTVLTLYHNQLKKGIEIVREYEDVPEIYCRPDELNQVWTNLLHNAIQAMKGHGKLTIKVVSTGTTVKVSFRDTGSGIPADIQERIFEPFFTTKPIGEGSGLGLDIVKRMVENHKGTIRVKSEPGNTVFTVRLPLVRT